MLKEITNRRSIRKYMPRPVEDEKIYEILESARIAPSGSNTQPWHFIIVKDDAKRQQLAEASHKQSWMNSAPVFIVCVADIRVRNQEDSELSLDESYPDMALKQIIRDTTIATDHLVLSAQQQGLGTCWVAWFTQDEIRPLLGIPKDKFVLAIITVGYADETPKPRPRKALEEIVHYEMW